jgi:anti-sigma B factor antagonist
MDKPIEHLEQSQEHLEQSQDLEESLNERPLVGGHQFVADSSIEAGVRVIALFGELDLASAPRLEREFEAALADDDGPIIVDLSDLQFMDSTGLRTLIAGQRSAGDQRRPFAVARRADSFIARLFEVAGADRAFDLHDTRDAALDAVRG